MKKTMVSLAAASLVMGTAAYADVNFDVSGQAKIYYETNEYDTPATNAEGDKKELFNEAGSKFNAGVQLRAKADLGNGFGFGTEATFLGDLGTDGVTDINSQTTSGENDVTFTQLYITKKINNTTVKAGRQLMAKSVSPFMYTEGWNVFKNSVEGVVVSNSDLDNTTLLAAYFGAANKSSGDMDAFTNRDTAMVGFTTKAIPNVKLTVNYYKVGSENNAAVTTTGVDDIIWADAQIAIPDVPVKIGLQGGNINADSDAKEDQTAFGVKISGKVENITLKAAYTSTDDGDVLVKNIATGVKSPLYTQMVYNQFYIAGKERDTWLVGAVANFGDAGKLIVNYSSCNDDATDKDFTELDVIYKIKSGGVQYFAAYVMNDTDDTNINATYLADDNDKVRFWAAYAF